MAKEHGEMAWRKDEGLRTSRIKAEGTGYYHCMSRVVDRRMILGEAEREKFRDLRLAPIAGSGG